MTSDAVAAWGQYGLLGLVLLFVFGGFAVAAKWYAANVLKPRLEADLKSDEANRGTRDKLAETVAALGLTVANTHQGVATLLATGQQVSIEFTAHRRAWRAAADALEVFAATAGLDPEARAELKSLRDRIHDAMDDGSREMRALTDDDREHADARPRRKK